MISHRILCPGIILLAFPLLIMGQQQQAGQLQQQQAPGGQCSNYDKSCWFGSDGCTLLRGNPFERRAFVTCEECLKLCLDRKDGPQPYCCKSVVYDSQWKFCDLFAIQANAQSDFVRYRGRMYFSPSGNCTAPTPPTSAPIVDCPPGQKAILSIYQNSSNTGFDSGTPINADTSDKCGLLCVQNKDDKGKPFACKAASFSQGKCIFSDKVPGPDTLKNLKPGSDPNALYLEKNCYPADKAGSCEAIILDPHHVLVGYNQKTVDASTFNQCLQECMNAKQKYQFTCNSGEYYADITTDNCILNVETRETKPDVYLATDDNNIYFEPHCATGRNFIYAMRRRARARVVLRDFGTFEQIPAVNRWSDWSECNARTNTKHRFRNCMRKRPTDCERQEVPCDFVDVETWAKEQDQFRPPCKPLIKDGRPDCTKGVRLNRAKGTREYGCTPNTAECWNFPNSLILS